MKNINLEEFDNIIKKQSSLPHSGKRFENWAYIDDQWQLQYATDEELETIEYSHVYGFDNPDVIITSRYYTEFGYWLNDGAEQRVRALIKKNIY